MARFCDHRTSPLSVELLAGKFKDGAQVAVDVEGDKITFKASEAVKKSKQKVNA